MIRLVLWVVTLARVALLPAFLLLALHAQELARAGVEFGIYRWGAVAVLLVIGLSDLVDGWLARRFDLATHAGAIADAVADKLVQGAVAAFFAFSRGPAFAPLPVWFFTIVVGRDLVLGGGWAALRMRRVPVRIVHRSHGRLSSSSVFVVLFWLVVGMPARGLAPLALLSSALIVASTMAYVLDGLAQAREASAGRTGPPPTALTDASDMVGGS
ncbi:MAG: CDP-alcohol phosphatidyltransferase family protein [Gemmatimonadota bacterium]|nr:CDP-alcohol phosphatidyltransferase family protein [Gemmatimonadota bacterium]MDH3421510.1 CDP-alcohol phosphatidyltransferase family protein [Gemmatimonadota bacterium]